MNQRFNFGKGENLIITTCGLEGDASRMIAASYLTTGEARQKIIDEKQPKEISERVLKAHSRQRALFVFNMHRLSSNLLDIIFNKKKHVSKTKPAIYRNRIAASVPIH